MTTIHRHTIIAKAIIALRTIDAGRPGLLDEKLAAAAPLHERATARPVDATGCLQRLRRQAATRCGASRYPGHHAPAQVARPDRACRRHVARATSRPPPSIEAAGSVAPTIRACIRLYQPAPVAGGRRTRIRCDLHARRHLLAEDVIPFFVLLSLETGLEPECVKALRLDCLRNPASGTVEIEYVKRRARGSEWKRLRVRDGASSTPGGIIRTLIELTTAARKHKPSESLWLYFHTGHLTDRHSATRRRLIDTWVARHDIVDDDGQPLHLLLSRLRKTHKALWYAKTQGDMARFAVGHTPEVAARHYADLPSLRHLHEQAVADGLDDALTSALQPRIRHARGGGVAAQSARQRCSFPCGRRGASDARAASRMSGWRAAAASTTAPSRPTASRAPSRSGAASNAVMPSSPRASCPPSSRSSISSSSAAAEMAETDWGPSSAAPVRASRSQVLPAFSDAVVADARERPRRSSSQPYLPLEARA